MSKSEIKRDANTYRKIAQTLIGLNRKKWETLGLSESIITEIEHAKKASSMEAKRRQVNFVAKKLRDIDLDILEQKMHDLLATSFSENKSKLDKQVRVTIERLTNPKFSETTLNSLVRQFPELNLEFVKEQLQNQTASNLNSSELYQYLHGLFRDKLQ